MTSLQKGNTRTNPSVFDTERCNSVWDTIHNGLEQWSIGFQIEGFIKQSGVMWNSFFFFFYLHKSRCGLHWKPILLGCFSVASRVKPYYNAFVTYIFNLKRDAAFFLSRLNGIYLHTIAIGHCNYVSRIIFKASMFIYTICKESLPKCLRLIRQIELVIQPKSTLPLTS